MKTILALHGNPGHPEDWQLLQQKVNLTAVNAYANDWVREVMASSDKVILLGHSWGAYKILKALPTISNKIEKVILLAPYVTVERPISGLAQKLLKTPWLGDRLIQGNHKKSKDAFLNDLIHPHKIEDLSYFKNIQTRLQNWQAWQQTAFVKIQMQGQPLRPADVVDTEIQVFYGKEDKISNQAAQQSVLQNYSKLQIHNLENAGHGLLWTHAELIAKELL